MEPDKFEKHIKDKLEERRIPPSDSAWDKISSKIETPTQQQKNSYFWVGIAASFILLLGLSVFFLNGTKKIDVQNSNSVVDVEEPVHIERSIENEDSIVLGDVEPDLIISNNVREDKGEREGNVQSRASFVQEAIPDTSAIAENAPSPPLEDDVVPLVSTEILDAKIAEVIAKVDFIELNGKVSDAEVDSLLLNAQKEILREKLFNMDKSVNAMALLSEVEEELDQSFRDQIFETLKTGFLKVRTAVADRNN